LKIGRTLPPAASPIYFADILSGLKGLFQPEQALARFKEELQSFIGVRHCFFVSSGKAALTLVLKALRELEPDRDTVLVPAFTCYSVPSAVLRAGLRLKLCDVDPDTLDFNYFRLERALDERTGPSGAVQGATSGRGAGRLLAVVAVHAFGIPSNIERVHAFAARAGAFVVEDAAQALGGVCNGKRLGALGDVGFFSLGRGKPLSCVEGGIIATDNEAIAVEVGRQAKNLPGYGAMALANLVVKALALWSLQRPALFWIPKGMPFLKLGETIFDTRFDIRKISGFQLGMLSRWKSKLSKFMEERQKGVAWWNRKLESDRYHFYARPNGLQPAAVRFPVRMDDRETRDRLLAESHRQGLGIMITYPEAISDLKPLRQEFDPADFPGARQLAQTLVTLPVHPYMTDGDRMKIMQELRNQP
jgi:perosamine synthetase